MIDTPQGSGPEKSGSKKGNRMKQFGVPLALALAAGTVAGDYLLLPEGPARKTATAVRAKYLDMFRNPEIECAKWRQSLAERAVEIVLTCDFLTAEEKAKLQSEIEGITPGGDYHKLFGQIDTAAARFYKGEMDKKLGPGFVSDLNPDEHDAAKASTYEQHPQLRQFLALACAYDSLNRVNKEGSPFRIPLSQAIFDCEQAMDYDGKADFHIVVGAPSRIDLTDDKN